MLLLSVLSLVATAVALPVLPEAPILPGSDIIWMENNVLRNLPKVDEAKDISKDDSKEEKLDEIKVISAIPPAPELPPLDVSILENLRRTIKESEESYDSKPEAEKSEEIKDKDEIHKYDEPEENDHEEDEPEEDEDEEDKAEEDEAKEDEHDEDEAEEDKAEEDEAKEDEHDEDEAEKDAAEEDKHDEDELEKDASQEGEPKEEEHKDEPKEEERWEEKPEKEDVKVTIDEVKEKPTKWKVPKPSFFNTIVSSLPFHIPSLSSIGWPFKPSIFGRSGAIYPEYILN